MPDPYVILNIEPTASADQIRAAYNRKKAELATLGADASRPDSQLQQIEDAYAQLMRHSQLAVVTASPPKTQPDPILSMVHSLSAPIGEGSEPVEMQVCPNCRTPNPISLSVCSCGQQLSRPCPNCGRPVLLGQAVCPRCKAVVGEINQQRLMEAKHTGERIQNERMADQTRTDAMGVAHTERVKFGIVFWILVLIGLIGLCVLIVFLRNQGL